jgi:hypothetical protein
MEEVNGKPLQWQDYQIVYETMKHGLVELDRPINRHDQNDDFRFLDTLGSFSPSPEELYIRKETYLSLSSETKEVLDIILKAPTEVLEALATTAQYDKLSKRKLRKWLKKNHHWTGKFVDKCFNEIRNCATLFEP